MVSGHQLTVCICEKENGLSGSQNPPESFQENIDSGHINL